MKQLLTFLILIGSASPVIAQNTGTLREHMRSMSYLMDEIFTKTKDAKDFPEGGRLTRELRQHLIQSLSLIPTKLASRPDLEKNMGLIEFHQLLARVVYLSASLEQAFIAENYEPESSSRQEDIKNLLHEINVISGHAHKLFRE